MKFKDRLQRQKHQEKGTDVKRHACNYLLITKSKYKRKKKEKKRRKEGEKRKERGWEGRRREGRQARKKRKEDCITLNT